MRQLAYALPELPGSASLRPKTYAAWPVWKDSTTDELQLCPALAENKPRNAGKMRAASTARRICRGSTAGRSAAPRIAVLYALLFDCPRLQDRAARPVL